MERSAGAESLIVALDVCWYGTVGFRDCLKQSKNKKRRTVVKYFPLLIWYGVFSSQRHRPREVFLSFAHMVLLVLKQQGKTQLSELSLSSAIPIRSLNRCHAMAPCRWCHEPTACYNCMYEARRKASSGKALLLFLVTCMHDVICTQCACYAPSGGQQIQ